MWDLCRIERHLELASRVQQQLGKEVLFAMQQQTLGGKLTVVATNATLPCRTLRSTMILRFDGKYNATRWSSRRAVVSQ